MSMREDTILDALGAPLDALAKKLEASGDYKVLRRLTPRQPAPAPAGYPGRIGIILDLETTGLDAATDEVIELGMVKFRYSRTDEITGVNATFQSFNQPARPIPGHITKLTGITDEMVVGHHIDSATVHDFVADANVVIAHNASFDRKFAERSWDIFAHKPWACSMTQIDWKQFGFAGAKLDFLLAGAGFFHDAHRAVDDCHAVLELLTRPLPKTSNTAFATLLDHARRKSFRILAENSPYDLKDTLKKRGYRWCDGSDGQRRSWYVDVDANNRDAELTFLRTEIYQREIDIDCPEITALERFSARA